MESTNYKYIQDYLRVLVNDNIDEEIPSKKERRGNSHRTFKKKICIILSSSGEFFMFQIKRILN